MFVGNGDQWNIVKNASALGLPLHDLEVVILKNNVKNIHIISLKDWKIIYTIRQTSLNK